MKLLVTGAAGLVGTEVVALAKARGHEVVGLARADLDVTNRAAVVRAAAAHRPDAVVHCAAYTAVDAAEAEADRVMAVNRDGTAHVARAAADVGAVMVYLSTDYIFDGAKGSPYLPGDEPRPLGVYASSKLAGERAVAAAGAEHLVLRSSWVYGAAGRHFVSAVLERARAGGSLRVVSDQRGRPTWSRNLAGGVIELLERGARGTWHVADGGEATWHDVAVEALHVAGFGGVPVEAVTTEAWGAPAPRPRYSVLDVSATEALLGRTMMHWTHALRRFLEGPDDR